MIVAEQMSVPVICVQKHEPLERAYQLMKHLECRHMPVVDNGDMVGILSLHDVMLHASKDGDVVKVAEVSVGEVMISDVVTCTQQTKITEAARLMTMNKISSLPVVDNDGKLQGVLTSTDLLRFLGRRQELEDTIELWFDLNLGEES